MKKRSFVQLKKSMTHDELNKFCKKITEEYANSEAQFARSYYTQKYNISVSCYYSIIEYAIVTNIVDDIITFKCMNKAIKNQKVHNKNAGCSSVIKYSEMYSKRCEYISISYGVEEIKRIAMDFADNPDISKKDLAASYGVSRRVIELLLIRAIEENIVEDNIVDAIEKRSVNNSTPDKIKQTKQYFIGLRKKRKAKKEKITMK